MAWLGEKNSGGGNDEVYLDSVDIGSISTVATNRESQQVLFGVQGLSSGSHTLHIVKSSGAYVEVDAFAVKL